MPSECIKGPVRATAEESAKIPERTGHILSRWRRISAPIIARVLAENAGKPEPELRAALRSAYSFGPCDHHPYKIWLDEIRIQTGRRKLNRREGRMQGRPLPPPDPRQELPFA